MSRSGYSDMCDGAELQCYRNAVDRALRGKRGRRMLDDLANALDEMPVKELISGSFHDGQGRACALGALADFRGVEIPMFGVGALEGDEIAAVLSRVLDIAPSLAKEVMWWNDDYSDDCHKRWKRVRRWVERNRLEKT